MKRAFVRLYAQLNDFLSPEKRMQVTTYNFAVSGSVKDVIESFGVPHTEVDLILANGKSVDFAYQVQDGDRICVYPTDQSLDIPSVIHLQPPPLSEPRFVADTHLGRLAAYLRMMGFDMLYRNDNRDEDLARLTGQMRILLTRDRGLLMRAKVTRGYFVRATDPRAQLIEVVHRLGLIPLMAPFCRCIRCNALLRRTEKDFVNDRLLPQTREHFDEFYICPECERIYWKGSHYRRMQRLIEGITASN
ncbi:MAG TPA: Mut7-C RNAse domain-containing protein [Acidobacteriota bacterium]|nr:Mut7-C RNAse domain-containing protein [Acidobacteriota bacterium]